jgi:hypothetical protein
MAFKIKTNNVPRNLLYGYELSKKERKEFDYIDAEYFDGHGFFRYKGEVYDPSDFMRATDIADLKGWDGYASDSYFSGIVIKYVDNFERVIVGTYTS